MERERQKKKLELTPMKERKMGHVGFMCRKVVVNGAE